ncbi:MAG TPA: hypothetical protein PKU83_10130 [Chryseolinea sp.]|nr:hypothetical protein [Chryseolinea sp.]
MNKTKAKMTHVKDAESFARLIGFCTGYGCTYNPGRQNLQLDALANQLNEMRMAMEKVIVAKTNYDNIVNHRIQTYHQLPRLVSSILRILESSGARPEKLDDARTFAHQLLGVVPKKRLPVPSDNTANTTKPLIHRSQRQLAYVSKADSFSKLVMAVSTEPLYQPREQIFTQAWLDVKVQELNGRNREVSDARALWSKALLERNDRMYRNEVSIIRTAQAVKKYVRAIFGHDSANYRLLKTLHFNMPTRK